jgi:hypothetical protein
MRRSGASMTTTVVMEMVGGVHQTTRTTNAPVAAAITMAGTVGPRVVEDRAKS